MPLDFERVAFGIYLAVVLPRLATHFSSWQRFVMSVAISTYAVVQIDANRWALAGLVFVTGIAASAQLRWRQPRKWIRATSAAAITGAATDWIFLKLQLGRHWRRLLQLIGVAALVAASAFLVVPVSTIMQTASVLLNNTVAISVFGLLNAVFVSGAIVQIAIRRPLRKLESAGEDITSLIPGSQLIGQLERFVVFTLVAGGQSDAAAVAIAIKSVVRIPEARIHPVGFVEYFLIGTLASVGASLANAVVVRLLLGQTIL